MYTACAQLSLDVPLLLCCWCRRSFKAANPFLSYSGQYFDKIAVSAFKETTLLLIQSANVWARNVPHE